MNADSLQEHRLGKNTRRELIVNSGAANTSAIEYTPIRSLHGGRETEALEQGKDGKVFLCLESCGGPNDLSLIETDWGRCVWSGNRFGRMVPSIVLLAWLAPPDVVFQSPIALSRGFLEEFSEGIGSVGETAYSASAFNVEQDCETRDWRGTFCLSYAEHVIFSQELELKTAQLPRWKPHVTIDLNRLERVNE